MTTSEQTTKTAQKMLANAEGGYIPSRHHARLANLIDVLREHSDARLESCGDENTGRRYGRAKCRAGRCKKIGSTTYAYQLWAVW